MYSFLVCLFFIRTQWFLILWNNQILMLWPFVMVHYTSLIGAISWTWNDVKCTSEASDQTAKIWFGPRKPAQPAAKAVRTGGDGTAGIVARHSRVLKQVEMNSCLRRTLIKLGIWTANSWGYGLQTQHLQRCQQRQQQGRGGATATATTKISNNNNNSSQNKGNRNISNKKQQQQEQKTASRW